MRVYTFKDITKDAWLLWLAVFVVYAGAVVLVLAMLVQSVRDNLVWPMTIIQAGNVFVVFFRSTFDPRFMNGLGELERMRFPNGLFGKRRRTRMLDPDWGLFAPSYAPTIVRSLNTVGLAHCLFLLASLYLHWNTKDLAILAIANVAAGSLAGVLYNALAVQSGARPGSCDVS